MSSIYDIQGRNCIFQMKIGDDYLDVLCAKTFSFNRVYDLKETTTVGSGFDKEFRYHKKSYTISYNGVVQVVAEANKPTIKTLFDYGEGFLPVNYRLIYEDNSGNVMVIIGTVYLSSAIFNANPINLLDGTIEMSGSGGIEILDELPQPVNITITSSGDPDIAALIQFKLMNDNGDIIFDSGQLPEASGGDLTHPVNVTGQVQSGSYYFFWQVNSESLGNQFDLDAPPTKTTNFNDGIVNETSFGVQIYDFTADRAAEFTLGVNSPPPACVAPAFLTGLNNPTATVGTPWHGSVTLSGSQPFSLSNVTVPENMVVSVVGNVISFDWAAPQAGNDQTISFDVTNACGNISYDDDIDVSSNPDGVSLNFQYTESASAPAAACNGSLYVNAIQILHASTNKSEGFVINPGDTVEVRAYGPSSPNKRIEVIDSIDGVIYDNTVNSTLHSYVFVTTIGHDYTVNVTVTNS